MTRKITLKRFFAGLALLILIPVILAGGILVGRFIKGFFIGPNSFESRKKLECQAALEDLKKDIGNPTLVDAQRIAELVRRYPNNATDIMSILRRSSAAQNILERLGNHKSAGVSNFARIQLDLFHLRQTKKFFQIYSGPPFSALAKSYEEIIDKGQDGLHQFKKIILENENADYLLVQRWSTVTQIKDYLSPMLSQKDPLVRGHACRIRFLWRLWKRVYDYRRSQELGGAFSYDVAERLRKDLVESSPALQYPRGDMPDYPGTMHLGSTSYWEFHPYYARVLNQTTILPGAHIFEATGMSEMVFDSDDIVGWECGPNVFRVLPNSYGFGCDEYTIETTTLFLKRTAPKGKALSYWYGHSIIRSPYLAEHKTFEPGIMLHFRIKSDPAGLQAYNRLILAIPSDARNVTVNSSTRHEKIAVSNWMLYVVDRTGLKEPFNLQADFRLSMHDAPRLTIDDIEKSVAGIESLGRKTASMDRQITDMKAEENAIQAVIAAFAAACSKRDMREAMTVCKAETENLNKESLAREFSMQRLHRLQVSPGRVSFKSGEDGRGGLTATVRVRERIDAVLNEGEYRTTFQTPLYILEKMGSSWRIVDKLIFYAFKPGESPTGFHDNLAHADWILNENREDRRIWGLTKTYYAAAYKEKPNDPVVTGKYADCLRNLGQYKEAKDLYSKAVRALPAADPSDKPLGDHLLLASLFARLAICHYSLGEKDAARKAADEAVRLNPYCAVAYYLVAMTMDGSEEINTMRQNARKASMLDPQHSYQVPMPLSPVKAASAVNERGLKLFAKKKYLPAFKRFEKAAILDPQSTTFKFNKANTLYLLGKYDAAQHEVLQCLAVEANSDMFLVFLAQVYSVMGKRDKAIDAYEKTLVANPFNIDARFELLNLLKEPAMSDKALKALEEGKEIFPNNLELRFELGKLYENMGRKLEALQEFKYVYNFTDDEEVQVAITRVENSRN